VIVIIALGIAAMGFSAMFVLALGRMAARADRSADKLLGERRLAMSRASMRERYGSVAKP
jgi:hypothetical protein